jgi:glycosyltransferase involved in cell wall biosynthesis
MPGASVRVCSPHCGLDPETTSGGETYERELLRHLAGQGVMVDLILARHKRVPEGVANWVVHRLRMGRGLRWPVAAVVFPPAIRRVYAETRFDLLRAHSVRYIGPAALRARRRYGVCVPIVAHHHHLDADPLNPWIEGPVMRGVDRVITVSEFSRRQAVTELGVPAERISVVYDGVDAKFAPAPKPVRLVERFGLQGKPVVLSLGGLKRRKNLLVLLDAWRRVVTERPDTQLVIGGTGPELDRLRAHARRVAPAGGVHFAGYVPEAEKVDYYNLGDVFVSTSALEGFGLTVAEAMACERPVVVSNRGSLPEVVAAGEGGFLCEPDDAGGFARAVLEVLGDERLRQKFGAANRARVTQLFRWERAAAQVTRVYEEVLDGWRRRPQAR